MRVIDIIAFPIRWALSPFTNLFTHLGVYSSSITDLKTFPYTRWVSFFQLLLLGGMIALTVLNPFAAPLGLLIALTLVVYLIVMPLIKSGVARYTLFKALDTFVFPESIEDDQQNRLSEEQKANIKQGIIRSAFEIGFLGEQPYPFFNALFYKPDALNLQCKNQFLSTLWSPISIAFYKTHPSGSHIKNTCKNLQMFLSLFYQGNDYLRLAAIARYAVARTEKKVNRDTQILIFTSEIQGPRAGDEKKEQYLRDENGQPLLVNEEERLIYLINDNQRTRFLKEVHCQQTSELIRFTNAFILQLNYSSRHNPSTFTPPNRPFTPYSGTGRTLGDSDSDIVDDIKEEKRQTHPTV